MRYIAMVSFIILGIVMLTRIAIFGADMGCVSYALGYISWGNWFYMDLAMGILYFPVGLVLGRHYLR